MKLSEDAHSRSGGMPGRCIRSHESIAEDPVVLVLDPVSFDSTLTEHRENACSQVGKFLKSRFGAAMQYRRVGKWGLKLPETPSASGTISAAPRRSSGRARSSAARFELGITHFEAEQSPESAPKVASFAAETPTTIRPARALTL